MTAVDLVVLICLAAQFVIASYYLLLLYWRSDLPPQAAAGPPLPADLPHVLVQIPVFNEPAVVERALIAAGRLEWPRDRLTIQLLDDSTDLTTDIAVHAVARLREQGIDIVHVRRAVRVGYKAGSLANGMSLHDAPYIAMFDADFVAPPDWLGRAMAALLANPKAAFVQTRIEWSNSERNWLTRAQRLMQDAHFVVEQDVRARHGVPFQFNGTGGIWRRAAVEEAGGWSHDTVSEDLDLVLRTHLKGWTGIFLIEPHVVGELPEKLEHFGVQQRRWSQGFVQVAGKLLPQVWNSDWPGEAKFTTTVALGQQLVFPTLVVLAIALVFSVIGHDRLLGLFRFGLWLWLLALLAVLFGVTACGYVRLKRGGMLRYLATALSVPALIVYLAVANAGAIVSAAFGRQTEFTRTPKTGS